MTVGRSPLGGLLRRDDGVAEDCCCDECCCPGLDVDTVGHVGTRLLWSVTSSCGLHGDLTQLFADTGRCVSTYGYFVSETKSLGSCDGQTPMPVEFRLTCVNRTGKLCERYELVAQWGNSGCLSAERGPWHPQPGCDCDPFYLQFKIPCPYGISGSCRCTSGVMTVTVTRVN